MADTCIGRVPEAAACANKFKKEGVSITLSVTPCWCYGSETMANDGVDIIANLLMSNAGYVRGFGRSVFAAKSVFSAA